MWGSIMVTSFLLVLAMVSCRSDGVTECTRVPSEVLVTVGVVNIEPDRVQLEVVAVKTRYYVLNLFLSVITVA
jgi:hypothetical protein